MAPIFGYGSLILPTSLISRFENIDTAIDDVYRADADSTVRDDAIDRWEERKDRITYLPAKLWGYRRYYSLESDRGDMMLEAVRTGDVDDWINGVLIFGLSDEEKIQVKGTESAYDYETIEDPRLEYYVDTDRIDDVDVTSLSEIEIFAKNIDPEDLRAENPRNRTYHERICTGIMMIGEMYGADVADEFYEDFCRSTYEAAYDADDATTFNTVAENNRIRGESSWPARP
ncbi:hypothetical protein HWV23_14105 [Natronomonas halophila]|uniref:hypothetical protein n=1 Tax=Natronomonas halophila TaxID=2747817 RepID=UPI0015B64F11|nr:hypothetical protein [Natronomonas halophila]QLD86810.1 hypothetical protein HWV23_14105 [Natronomonas halophila]